MISSASAGDVGEVVCCRGGSLSITTPTSEGAERPGGWEGFSRGEVSGVFAFRATFGGSKAELSALSLSLESFFYLPTSITDRGDDLGDDSDSGGVAVLRQSAECNGTASLRCGLSFPTDCGDVAAVGPLLVPPRESFTATGPALSFKCKRGGRIEASSGASEVLGSFIDARALSSLRRFTSRKRLSVIPADADASDAADRVGDRVALLVLFVSSTG